MNIPRRSLGFLYKACSENSDSIVKLTAFLDFTCPDSQRAFPVLLDLAMRMSGKHFELVVQPFPLPYSRNSHTITKLIHVVDKATKGKDAFRFMSDVFHEYETLRTSAVADKTDNEILDILIPMAALVSDMSINTTKEKFSQRSCEMAARLDFKYSCTRGVYATPTFLLNDVSIAADPTWKLQDWLSVIDPLL